MLTDAVGQPVRQSKVEKACPAPQCPGSMTGPSPGKTGRAGMELPRSKCVKKADGNCIYFPPSFGSPAASLWLYSVGSHQQ
jgi:hypothetical protein